MDERVRERGRVCMCMWGKPHVYVVWVFAADVYMVVLNWFL